MKLRHLKPVPQTDYDPRDPIGTVYTFRHPDGMRGTVTVLEKIEDEASGVFVGVKFSEETNDAIMNFIESQDIPNPVTKDKLHCTVMYTYSDAPDLIEESRPPLIPAWNATPDKFEIFKTQDDNNCLVLRIKCDELTERHEKIIADYGVVYTHDEYKPHITLSYDCGDLDISTLDKDALPDEILITEEYASSIDPDWV